VRACWTHRLSPRNNGVIRNVALLRIVASTPQIRRSDAPSRPRSRGGRRQPLICGSGIKVHRVPALHERRPRINSSTPSFIFATTQSRYRNTAAHRLSAHHRPVGFARAFLTTSRSRPAFILGIFLLYVARIRPSAEKLDGNGRTRPILLPSPLTLPVINSSWSLDCRWKWQAGRIYIVLMETFCSRRLYTYNCRRWR